MQRPLKSASVPKDCVQGSTQLANYLQVMDETCGVGRLNLQGLDGWQIPRSKTLWWEGVDFFIFIFGVSVNFIVEAGRMLSLTPGQADYCSYQIVAGSLKKCFICFFE